MSEYQPVTKTFEFVVMEGEPVLECMSLLIQSMQSYEDLTEKQKSIIARWFFDTFNAE